MFNVFELLKYVNRKFPMTDNRNHSVTICRDNGLPQINIWVGEKSMSFKLDPEDMEKSEEEVGKDIVDKIDTIDVLR